MNTADVTSKGTERSAHAEAALSATGLDVLGALRTGIVSVLPDWRLLDVNPAAATALGVGDAWRPGADFWGAFPAFHEGHAHDAIVATLADGVTRVFHLALPGGAADGTFEVRAARTGAGRLVLELREAQRQQRPSDESDPIRDLAHRVASGSDADALLALLCEFTRDTCGADGAAVAQLAGSDGVIAAASGMSAPEAGSAFDAVDSLAGSALRSRALIVERDDPSLACPLFPPGVDVGEVVVAPLIAAERPLGVLCAWHMASAPTFSTRDRQRLRTVADFAALVLMNSRLMEEAQAAVQAKSAFLATISHELRTPLTALTGYGELLADEIFGPLTPHQIDMVDRMRSVTHQLAVMVDELLTFSSLEAGRETVRVSDVSLVEILDTVVAAVEPFARQKELVLGVEVPDHAPVLHTDADKVRQILVNLVGNAIKFTDRGRVDVAAMRRDGELRVDVRDTGIGIEDADRARLFQPFTQLDSGLTRRHGGTGLGLYNSGRLAQLLGGRIDVASTPGEGSTFSLIIPIRYSEIG